MYFHHLHFYVWDVALWRDWFINKLGFSLASASSGTEVVTQGAIEIRLSGGLSGSPFGSSSGSPDAAATEYLCHHPPGIADVGFATDDFETVLARSLAEGATLTSEVSLKSDGLRQCQLRGWADLRHTLVEVSPQWVAAHLKTASSAAAPSDWLCAIDHVVLNVPQGELAAALAWYQRVFGLISGQQFDITTNRSGLRSQVLTHPHGTLQLPINEPSSANSQIQEFLDHNRGPGIQHVALRSHDAVLAIAHFRQQGLELISIPTTYYDSLHQRSDCPLLDTSAASQQQLLLDWTTGGQQGMLLQTFTKPIFSEPTFFFEIIERSIYTEAGQTKWAQGFGEGNFQALFEAIELAQVERGSFS